jgi:hypothetical protein
MDQYADDGTAHKGCLLTATVDVEVYNDYLKLA